MLIHHWQLKHPMGNQTMSELLIPTILMGLVTEVAAMEITLIIIVMELPIILMDLLAMVKIIKIKVTIMNIKMEHTNQGPVVYLVMFKNSKTLNIKLNNIMQMLVKNMDKIRYGIMIES
jgi:hypothetical protein